MAKPFLSVIIPAHNEAKRLPLTLIDLDKHLSEQEFSYEILVVNDGSTDDTAEITRRFELLIKNLKLIDNKENKGKGGVVKQGMLAAKGAWRLFMDADNSTSIVEFNKMIPYFKNGYDVVIADRDIKGSRLVPAQPWYKRILGNIGNLIIQILLVPGIWDTQCGFKCYSQEAAEKIFRLTRISRWGFDAETLALAKKLGYKIKEIPVFWVNDTRSQVRLSAYLQVLLETAKVRWWLWRNVYNINDSAVDKPINPNG
ncbi:MAG: glycosyl transferase, group 2 family [Parcubacteria group bacterium Athens0714_26]|nr:MAG: glycosyl transferase, group 2 family [Parcubacteria group bacterium Athens1014_26]TSD03288.1 MAG: glycosyl transferase, group 2 family [Parcubacteria group bacterium Athens0714_26]